MVKRRMPGEEPRFSDKDVDFLLSQDDEWLRIGSRLYHISDGLMDKTKLQRFQEIYVGYKVAEEEDDEFTVGAHIERQATMLFAMAMEAWMKGLLLSQEQDSSWGSVKERYWSRIQATQNMELGSESPSVFGEFWDAVFEEQRKVIDRHKNHDLLRLANDCGLTQYLNPDDQDFLKQLGSAIERGRYPASFRAHKMAAPDIELSNTITWSRLRTAVMKRFRDLWPEGL